MVDLKKYRGVAQMAVDYAAMVATPVDEDLARELLTLIDQQPTPEASGADDYRTHHDDFRVACLVTQAHAQTDAGRSYWQHQVDVLDRIKGNPAPPTSATFQPHSPEPELSAMRRHEDGALVTTPAITFAQQDEVRRIMQPATPADESGADVCKACKGSGEVDGYVEHPSGDPQDAYAATVTCPQCDGTGDVPPAAPAESVVFQGTTAQLQSAYFGDWSAARAWAGKNGSVTMHTVRRLQIAETTTTQPRAAAQEGFRWDLLPAYLIDHHEGDIMSEELLQRAVANAMHDAEFQEAARLTQPAGDLEGAARLHDRAIEAAYALNVPSRELVPLLAVIDEAATVMERARKLLNAAGLTMEGGTISEPYNAAITKLRAITDAPPAADEVVLVEHSGCGHGLQAEQINVSLHPGDKVVLRAGRYRAAIDAARRARGEG